MLLYSAVLAWLVCVVLAYKTGHFDLRLDDEKLAKCSEGLPVNYWGFWQIAMTSVAIVLTFWSEFISHVFWQATLFSLAWTILGNFGVILTYTFGLARARLFALATTVRNSTSFPT